MKKEDLMTSFSGIEISDEALNKAYEIINKAEGLARQSLENEKNSMQANLDSANSKLADYQKTIDSLSIKAKENEDIAKELNDLRKAQRESEAKTREATRLSQIESALELKMGDRKFVNDFTKKAIIDEVKEAVSKDDNMLGIGEIFDNLTKDRDGIFANVHQAPNMPNASTVDNSQQITKEMFNKMKYKERAELFESNKDLYDSLVEQ